MYGRPRPFQARRPRLATLGPALLPTLIVALLACPSSRVAAQGLDARYWVTDGRVKVIAPWGNTVYVGGDFTYLGPNTGGLAGLDEHGRIKVHMPRVDGDVVAVVSDGAAGWYIGGNFGTVAGLSRPGLARILADGSVSGWAPDPAPASGVIALEQQGNRVFVVNGLGALVAYDATTGQEDTGWAPGITGDVSALAVHGTTLFAGGDITFTLPAPLFSGSGLAAIDTGTGTIEAWDPAPDGAVTGLYIAQRWLHVAGGFSNIGGQPHSCLARVHADTKSFDGGWNADVDSPPKAMLLVGDRLWIGGTFFLVSGQIRDRIAVVDTTTGAAVGPAPNLFSVNGTVSALAHQAPYMYLGLSPYDPPLTPRAAQPMVIRMPAATGTVDDRWRSLGEGDPLSNVREVTGLQVTPAGLLATGDFLSLGGRSQTAIAAFDRTTGRPRTWDPAIASTEAFPNLASVSAIVPTPHAIYVGGHFTHAGGQARASLAALDSASGRAQPWQADLASSTAGVVGTASALALHQDKLIVGGSFVSVGGQSLAGLAQVDTSAGTPVPGWSADVTGVVTCLLVQGSTVFAGGAFSAVDGQSITHLAAVNASTGNALAWNANVQGIAVHALAAQGDTLYVGGDFSHVGGQGRPCLAAVATADAALRGWGPAAFGPVRALLVDGPSLFVGGEFSFIAGSAEPYFARIQRFTGGLLLGAPAPTEKVLALAGDGGGGSLFAGGEFGSFAFGPTAFLARMGGMETTGPAVSVVAANGGEWLVPGSTYRLEYAASDPAGVASVDLELSRTGLGGPWTLLAAGLWNTGDHEWLVTGPEVAANAYLRVTARDFGGNEASDVSDLAFTIGGPVTSVGPGGDGVFPGGFALRPNPARDRAELRFSPRQPLRARVRLLDVQGREVWGGAERAFAPGEQVLPLDLSGLPAGLYFLRVDHGRGARTARLAVLR
jgi:hypothetical protein